VKNVPGVKLLQEREMMAEKGWEGEVQSVALAIIGDEVLAGEVQDANLAFLAREVARAGAELTYAAVLPDRMEFMVDHLRFMAGRFDHVIATGGIGATHDDLTRQAAANVFSRALVEHPGAVAAMEKGYGPLKPKTREMAMLPAGCELIPNPVTHAPGFTVENLIVLPGIPELVQAMFPFVAGRFSGAPLLREELRTLRNESQIAEPLAAAAREFPTVKMGSYPVLHGKGYRVRLVLRSRDAAALAAALRRLREIIEE
jgi:molybdenum cofactor synthesis domain-containing protein